MDKPKLPDCDHMCDCLSSMSDGTASLHLSDCPVYVLAAHHAAWEAYVASLEAEVSRLSVFERRIEAIEQAHTLSLSPSVNNKAWQDLANRGELIKATKECRAVLGCGLREAHDVVTTYVATIQTNGATND